MRGFWFCFSLLVLLGFPPRSASAHAVSNSHWVVLLNDDGASGQLRVAIRDLDAALGLDDDGDGLVGDVELNTHGAAIQRYLLEHLELSEPGRPCQLAATGLAPRGSYLELGWRGTCGPGRPLSLRYDLFFEHDASHRAYLDVTGQSPRSDVFSAGRRSISLETSQDTGFARVLSEYVVQGVRHILVGWDHIAFLVTLLLASVLGVGDTRAREPRSRRAALAHVAGVVSAFTAAHSLTLSLAALGLVTVSGRWVEPLIALSVALAALNNLWPLVRRRVWLLAFGFGLLHGFGFAGVLLELGLAPARRAAALFGFNLGVELGQLGLCAVLFPLLSLLGRLGQRSRFDVRWLSGVLAAAGLFWCVERTWQGLVAGAASGSASASVSANELPPSAGDVLSERGEKLLTEARWAEAHPVLVEAERQHRQEGRLAACARDNSLLGDVLVSSADPAGAKERYAQALALYEQLGDRAGAARQHQNLGVVARLAGDPALAARQLRRAIELYEALAQPTDAALAMAALGRIYLGSGAYADAEAMYQRANAIERDLDRRRQLARNHNQLGNLYLLQGDLARAEAMYDESTRHGQAAGDTLALANGVANLAGVYARTGRVAAARELYERCIAWFEASGADTKARRVRGLLAHLERGSSL